MAKTNRFNAQWPVGTIFARNRGKRRWVLIILVSAVLACVSSAPLGAGQQYGGAGLQPPPSSPFPDMDEMDPELAQRQLRALNSQRQKELVKDTAKLLILAKALNAQTQGDNAATLTESQWKEIDRIAKLAHSVKEKMVQTYGGRQIFEPQMGPPIR